MSNTYAFLVTFPSGATSECAMGGCKTLNQALRAMRHVYGNNCQFTLISE